MNGCFLDFAIYAEPASIGANQIVPAASVCQYDCQMGLYGHVLG
jgi:hypothetical protein